VVLYFFDSKVRFDKNKCKCQICDKFSKTTSPMIKHLRAVHKNNI